jgi:ABC-type Zn uptake system ZnuABC Zn-binding protein ZnuA
VLLKPNQDAHDFQLEPSQVRALDRADLVLRNGVGLDFFAVEAVSDEDKVAIVADGVALREGNEEHGEEEEGEDHEAAEEEAAGHDPHIWFSVTNARAMVTNIRDAFTAADPDNAAGYATNATAYLANLDSLDASIRSQVASLPSACRKLVTNHDVLGYYAGAYGFEIVGSVIPSISTSAQASASDVAEIVQKIRAENVPAIFAEASINPALIQQVGREAGVKVVDDLYGDSLGPAGSDGATYIDMMKANTTKVVDALKGCRG